MIQCESLSHNTSKGLNKLSLSLSEALIKFVVCGFKFRLRLFLHI